MPKENFIQEAIKSVAAKRRAARPGKPEPKPLSPMQVMKKKHRDELESTGLF